MRNIVQTLWNNIMNPLNDERVFDMISFISLVFNGDITDKEVQELMKGQ